MRGEESEIIICVKSFKDAYSEMKQESQVREKEKEWVRTFYYFCFLMKEIPKFVYCRWQLHSD